MPEPTSGLTLTDLQKWAGFKLGYGRDSIGWDTEMAARIADVIGVACRRVHVPEQVQGPDGVVLVPGAYPWTFLRPLVTLTLEDGARYVDLPDDFAGIEGLVTITQSGNSNFGQIEQMNPVELLGLYDQQPDRTGVPKVWALEPLKGVEPNRASRYRLNVWPQADGAYSLQVQYRLTPDALSTERPYPYGGAAHAELYRSAVIAACEFEINGQAGEEEGRFRDRLVASVALDTQAREQRLGYVGDTSDERYWRGRDMRHGSGNVPLRFNGTVWD